MYEKEWYFELPTLNSAMFKKSGYVHVNQNRMNYVETWKLQLWEQTFHFYCNMYGMDHQLQFKPHDVVEISWWPREWVKGKND